MLAAGVPAPFVVKWRKFFLPWKSWTSRLRPVSSSVNHMLSIWRRETLLKFGLILTAYMCKHLSKMQNKPIVLFSAWAFFLNIWIEEHEFTWNIPYKMFYWISYYSLFKNNCKIIENIDVLFLWKVRFWRKEKFKFF